MYLYVSLYCIHEFVRINDLSIHLICSILSYASHLSSALLVHTMVVEEEHRTAVLTSDSEDKREQHKLHRLLTKDQRKENVHDNYLRSPGQLVLYTEFGVRCIH